MDEHAETTAFPLRSRCASMSEDLCERVFGRVIRARQDLSPSTRARLLRALRLSLKIPGFRDAGNAPENMLLQHSVCAFQRHSEELAAVVLQAWFELQEVLATRLRDYLTRKAVSTGEPTPFPLSFVARHTSAEMSEWADQYVESSPEATADEVVLMAFCLTEVPPEVFEGGIRPADTTAPDVTDAGNIRNFSAVKDRLSEVEREVESLATRFHDLGARLANAGAQLTDQNTLPPPELSEEIENVRGDFAALKERVTELCRSCNVPSDGAESTSALGDLRASLESIAVAARRQLESEETRRVALDVLDRIQGLTHREQRGFEQLIECQARARDLHLSLMQTPTTAVHPDAEALADGTHPFARLLFLVEHGHKLDDEQWQAASDCVSENFGRLLSTAIVRGKLVAAPASPTHEEKTEEGVQIRTGGGAIEFGGHIEESPGGTSDENLAVSAETEASKLARDAETPPVVEPIEGRERAPEDTAELERHSTATNQPAPTVEIDHERERVQHARNAIWSLLNNGRSGLAFHLAHCVEELFPGQRPALAAWVIHGVALASHILTPNGDIAGAIRSDFAQFQEDIFEAGNSDWNQALRFLLAAAAMRPALIAPSTGAAAILHSLRFKDGVSAFYDYCRTIVSHADSGQPLDPSSLKRLRSQAGWQAEVDSLLQEVNAWCSRAPSMTMVFAPASKVWWNWQAPSGLINALLQPVRLNEVGKRAVVTELIDRLGDETRIKREIAHTDRETLKRKRGDDISAKALGQLLKHTREAVSFARRWLELHENNPALDRGYPQTLVENVRQAVLRWEKDSVDELEGLSDQNPSPAVLAALSCCLNAVNDINRLFDPDSSLPPSERSPSEALNVDLLCTPLPLTGEWELDASPAATAEAILEFLETGSFSLKDAFARRTCLRDHQGTALVLEQLEKTGASAEEIDSLREEREKNLAECRSALRREITQTQTEVEKAVAFGLLRERERFDLVARVDKIELASSEMLRFGPAREELHRIRDEIEGKRKFQVSEVRRRLDESELEEAVRQRVLDVLAQGDVLAANEYIDVARSGRPLPPGEVEPDAFSRFFPESYKAIENFLEPHEAKRRPDPSGLVRNLRSLAKGSAGGNALGPVPLSQVRGKQIEQAADMLEAWFTTKRSQRADAEAVRQILFGIGFGHARVAADRTGRRVWLRLTCDPLRDRERCPVSFFGSAAEGHYRLLCVWDRPTEEDLIADVSETTHGPPAIVFYFGRLSEKVRRDLAEWCRRRRRTFIVVDDVLMLHLCGERGSRLPAMFRCTLPFTFLEPYAVTAGLVPPEMFYGREAERQQVMDPMGSCFIYGGRQLGKTALLRDVEQTFHNPDSGHVALWLDLKTYGIGVDRPIDEIWNRLGAELKRFNVVPQGTPSHASADTILKHVQDWLDHARDRRMLLLLDEADRFLDQDGKEEFANTARLKGVMDRTSRRFKVVFAGLHNVQRTTRLENNPLAHYGEPICIGPLLENGEWDKARQLVEQPLLSIGYRFESPDLITRILSQTNYYPSLIQLYCNQLLRHIYDRRADVPGPPYTITSRDVEEAYQNQELRKAIRDRFTWTLDLDPRYRLIAFCLALHSSEEPDRADRAVSVSWIREQALSWWPEGFREVLSEDVFRVLLDEMVGLGVLRTVEGGQYGLRSLNVITFLGSRDEIESEICSFFEREAPAPFEAATFRSSFRTSAATVDPAQRNPLTAAQESELRARRNGASIVFGCEAAGLGGLEAFLALTFGDEFLLKVDGITEMSTFARRMKELNDRRRDGVTLVLVTSSCSWSPSWVTEALSRTSKLTSKNAFVRILFVADPMTTWGMVPELAGLIAAGASTLQLTPWHDAALQHWLDDNGFANVGEADRKRIAGVTGNWSFLLKIFHERCRAATHQWPGVLAEIEREIERTGAVDGFTAEFLFGVKRREVSLVLRDLAEFGEASAEDLAALSDEVSRGAVQHTLRWGAQLSLVQPQGDDQFRLEPTLARMLAASAKATP